MALPAKTSLPVREYIKRVASIDFEEYPDWNVSKPLPKLPVPDLHSTFSKYLLCIKPIVSDEQYEHTAKLVNDFIQPGGEGEALQDRLKERAEKEENWAYDWWLDDMYLKNSLPLPVNSNPGMVFPRTYFEDENRQFRFAARLISGILDYKVIIDARGLPIDRARHREPGQPLCMEQYYRLFSSYRVPGVKKDNLVTATRSNVMQEPEHVIVICKNQLFVLDVVVNFLRLSEDNICMQLRRIVRMAEEGEREADPIGILTALPRDHWARARMSLMEESTNRDNLDMIERCIFVLCLDKSIPLSFNHQQSVDETAHSLRDDKSLLMQMVHGSGTRLNSCNRWFDKTMQFIIGEDGALGLNYEHSPSEGIAVVQLIEHVLKYIEEVRAKKLVRMASICELSPPRTLRWRLSNALLDDINTARIQMDKTISGLDMYILNFTNFGKEFPKSQNMSPDSFIQLALQLTYYKIHCKLVSTYESASIRRFRKGRVDNIRAASVHALAWVKAMVEETVATDYDKIKLLRKAMAHQTEIMVETILGHGMDCHLLGLKEMASEMQIETPAVFSDNSFLLANTFTLSTSQVNTSMDSFMGYGPVTHNGYGASYNPKSDFIVFCISSFNECGETQSDFFAFTLESSLLQMYELCLKTQQPAEITKLTNGAHGLNGAVSPKGSPRVKQRKNLVRQKTASHSETLNP